MTLLNRHSRLLAATSHLAALSALLLVLVAPLASAWAFSPSAQSDFHACCAGTQDGQASDHSADCDEPRQVQCQSTDCTCHLMPDDSAPSGDVVALTSTTFAFGPAVALKNNLQVDIPLARAPNQRAPSQHLGFRPASTPLYLLHGVLRL